VRGAIAAGGLLLALAGPVPAQQPEAPLRVGTHVAPPFVMRTADGGWEGISVALWEGVAAGLGRTWEWHETSVDGMVDEVASGALDLSVGALTVTPEREARVDFSHPTFRAALGAAVPRGHWEGLSSTLQALTSREFLATLGLLLVLLFVVGALAWAAERRRNPEEFEPEVRRGLGSGFWWAAVTMSTVGYGDKTPLTPLGRIIAMLWMLAALILTAVFTAQLAANITAQKASADLRSASELARYHVGVVAGAASFEAVRRLGARPTGFPDVSDGLAALEAGGIDVFVHDAPILAWDVAAAPGVTMSRIRFDPQDYAIALPQGSPLREPLNRALLAYLESPDWEAVLRRYLGPEAAETR
jgi:ABC-type amino acid transport substrate-binding protein